MQDAEGEGKVHAGHQLSLIHIYFQQRERRFGKTGEQVSDRKIER